MADAARGTAQGPAALDLGSPRRIHVVGVGGSGMSGKTLWAVIGPLVALVGVGIGVAGLRRRA